MTKGVPLFSRDTSIMALAILATALNRGMAQHFDNDDWNNAYVTTDLLPSLTNFAEAATAAFGSKVTGTKPTARRFNILNGIN